MAPCQVIDNPKPFRSEFLHGNCLRLALKAPLAVRLHATMTTPVDHAADSEVEGVGASFQLISTHFNSLDKSRWPAKFEPCRNSSRRSAGTSMQGFAKSLYARERPQTRDGAQKRIGGVKPEIQQNQNVLSRLF